MSSLKPKAIISLFYESAQGLTKDFGSVHAAALGYYILLSIFPLATLSAIIITRIVGPAALSGDYEVMLSKIVGAQYSGMLQNLITESYSVATNNVWTMLNILVLIYASSYMFYQARISLDALWHLSPRPGVTNSLLATMKTYTLAYGVALLVGLSFLALLFFNTAINMFSNLIQNKFNLDFSALRPAINIISSPIIYTGIFLIAFRYLPQAKARFMDLLPGALLTAILYWVGNYLYGIYLSFGSSSTIYGVASSMVLFLFWIYYSAMIFLYGAKFTGLYVTRYGNGITPHFNMMIMEGPKTE
jgi:membrane protein